MIISHRHRFIFQHCRKTAGGAIQTSLFRYLGPRDISTNSWGDAVREGVRPNLRAMWWTIRPPGGTLLVTEAMRGLPLGRRTLNRAFKATAASVLDLPSPETTHMPAAQVAERFEKEWQHYFKFCVVRNPYDRILSDYRWRTRNMDGRPTFSQYLRALDEGRAVGNLVSEFYDNWPLYTIDDKVAVDHVCRFERLIPDLVEALSCIGLDWDRWLPHTKANPHNDDYRTAYGRVEREIVERRFGKELEEFGYKF